MSRLVGYLLLFPGRRQRLRLRPPRDRQDDPARKPDAEKKTIYECGEPTIGSAWVQFDLRFYVVALLFVIFDVEVAFFFPWAVVFGKANNLAMSRAADERRRTAGLHQSAASLSSRRRCRRTTRRRSPAWRTRPKRSGRRVADRITAHGQ